MRHIMSIFLSLGFATSVTGQDVAGRQKLTDMLIGKEFSLEEYGEKDSFIRRVRYPRKCILELSLAFEEGASNGSVELDFTNIESMEYESDIIYLAWSDDAKVIKLPDARNSGVKDQIEKTFAGCKN